MLPLQGARVPSLVRELRSRMLHGGAKEKKKKSVGLEPAELTKPVRKPVKNADPQAPPNTLIKNL